jgi:hypothetical protein
MMDLLRERLVNQKLARSGFRDPGEVVSWFGAVQAQDFPGARWALGLRATGLAEAEVLHAYNEGAILRTHVLRPTWHLVAAADIRWLIALTGPRIIRRLGPRHRYLELDDRTVARSRAAIARALDEGPLTRPEIGAVLQRARIRITPERLTHLLVLAELEGIVCSGPMRGPQTTYALMDDRAPASPPVERGHALGRLAARYFNSHGPATVADFAWWSGLPLGEARAAIEMAEAAVSRDAVIAHDRGGTRARSRRPRGTAWLLPNFDEFLVAYKDRAAVLGDHLVPPRDVLAHTVIIDGRAVGTWKARLQRSAGAEAPALQSLAIAIAPRVALTRTDKERIRQAAMRYGRFIGREAVAVVVGARGSVSPRGYAFRGAGRA